MTLRPSSVADLAAMTRDAAGQAAPLRIVGGGSWLRAGGEVSADAERLDVSALSGILEYVPGDLTLTARTGTTLADLDAATAPHGQWCPLLPWGTDDATLGAVFATATTGPFHLSLGRPRDLALGLEFVDGSGSVARGGGRVVKNVAGFDLTRLLVGSWGTLGTITEVSVRLRGRPKVDETWAVDIDPDDLASRARLGTFERGPHAPLAAALLGPDESAALGLARKNLALIRLGGNASHVASSRDAIRALGPALQCDSSVWTRFRATERPENAVAIPRGFADSLSRRIKQQFDPRHILNPGILGEAAA
ncbi:MAG: FAD-binding oxidoreductase [Gemmatimonadales bacterium]